MTRFTKAALGIILFLSPLYNVSLSGQDLKPHNVIIRSSYQKESDLQSFTRHTFRVLESNNFDESYTPPLPIRPYSFSEKFALSIRISGLTMTFGEFSEVFLKERGVLENAYIYFRNREYPKAETKLITLLPTSKPIGEKVRLLLAWSNYKTNQLEAAHSYAKPGFKAKQKPIRDESFYLAALIYYQDQKWKELIDLYKTYQDLYPETPCDSRVYLTYLTALAASEKWKAANQSLKQIDFRRFAHTQPIYKLHELAGIVYFKNRRFQKSLQHFLSAKRNNKILSYQPFINRAIAWNYYVMEQYENAARQIETSKTLFLVDYDDELKYLLLACYAHQEKWNKVADIFDAIPQTSIFYNHAAFKIQSRSVAGSIDPILSRKIKKVRYNFPNMAFQTALYNGNLAFNQKLYGVAETSYLKALAADIGTDQYTLAQYNLGLTHLKKAELKKAEVGFSDLSDTFPPHETHLVHYHLFFIYYQLGQGDSYLDLYNTTDLSRMEPEQNWEIEFMRASILLAKNSNKDAAHIFLSLWERKKEPIALESAVKALYKDKQFEYILTLSQRFSDTNSELLSIYKVKSLLGTKKPKAALEEIRQTTYDSEEYHKLQLEVWMANGLFPKIITEISKNLNRNLSDETRLLYYLGLGDAHFNLKEYTDSKNQFYKALSLTNDPTRKSLIQYNIALVTYYTEDYPSFLQESRQMLKNPQLTPDVRYNLTQLLVNYYQQDKQPMEADRILSEYISKYSYQRVKAKVKRGQLLYQNGFYAKCFQHTQTPDPEESFFQKRDRLILAGYCGNQTQQSPAVITRIKTELDSSQQTYRLNELRFILAQANYNTGNYQNSKILTQQLKSAELDVEASQKRQLLLADSLIQLKQFKKAEEELGSINQYRQTRHYEKALELNASIKGAKGDIDNSVRSLFRIYYMPDTSPVDKQIILIKICELLQTENRESEAKSYFKKIDKNQLQKEPKWLERLETLNKRLN